MLTKLPLLLLAAVLFSSAPLLAQIPGRQCATADNEQILLNTDPAYAARRAAI